MFKSSFRKILPCVLILVLSMNLISCQNNSIKYLPPDGTAWLFAGQDLEAVGGLDKYNQGYVDYIGVPAGVTTYTNSIDLAGLYKLGNWGSGDTCAQFYLESEKFKNVMIAIGFFMSGDLDNVISGVRDENIKRLGEWIKQANRPVFLRIGYEFDGEWNAYDPEKYKQAFIKIVDTIRSLGSDNFVSVWQSSGNGDKAHLMQWYPGDQYVDWVGYSYFDQGAQNTGKGILEIAREKKKPAMIAEATPKRDLSQGDSVEHWKSWFAPFFKHILDNSDVIKAVAYINVRWMDQPMWKEQNWGDSRVQVDDVIKQLWIKEIKKTDFLAAGTLNSSDKVYQKTASELAAGAPIDGDKGDTSKAAVVEGALEAEKAIALGGARFYDDPAASNGKGISYIMKKGDAIIFIGVGPASKLTVRYAAALSGKLGIYLNGTRIQDMVFESTGAWVKNYKELAFELQIPENSEIKLAFDEGDTATNIDYIKLDK